MNKARKTEFLILLASLFLSANNDLFSQAGGAAVPFLLISPDARGSGMGEVGTAIADDINAVFWNPAGLGFLDYMETEDGEEVPFKQASLTYSRWLPQFNADLYYAYGTYGQYIKYINGTLAFNITFMNLGEFTRTFENGTLGKPFQSNEFAASISYGTIIATDLSFGGQIRYIQSNLAPVTQQTGDGTGVGRSFSIDVGLLWKPTDLKFLGLDLSDVISLGFNLSNVGPKMTYLEESDPLPTMCKVGAALNVVRDEFNDLKIAVDVGKLLVHRDSLGSDPIPVSLVSGWETPGVELSIGAEYWYEQIVAFRVGFFTEPSVLGNRKYWNFGAGVRYEIFNLDFSYINTVEENHPLANTMRFSMLVDL